MGSERVVKGLQVGSSGDGMKVALRVLFAPVKGEPDWLDIGLLPAEAASLGKELVAKAFALAPPRPNPDTSEAPPQPNPDSCG